MMNEHQKGIQLGLRAAATYLESEADDLVQRRKGQSVLFTVEELATYLRMKAHEVRELTVTRGR